MNATERTPRNPDNAVISAKLRALREGAGMTVEEMGEAINRHGSRISKWENGEGFPTPEDVLEYARYFGISLEALCDNEIVDAPEATPGDRASDHDPCLREVLDRLGTDMAMDRLMLAPDGEAPRDRVEPGDRGAAILAMIGNLGRELAMTRLLAIEEMAKPAPDRAGDEAPGSKMSRIKTRLRRRTPRKPKQDDNGEG
jgi:transcriptional regulator with XRE-family HTH domain